MTKEKIGGEKPWMTPEETREYLGGISNSTLIRYRRAGLICNYITPNTPRYFRDDVDEWIRKTATRGTTP
jgi:predicted site-specific integrase-resolvase